MINKIFYEDFLEEFDYPQEARISILDDFMKINSICSRELNYIIELYSNDIECDFNIIFDAIKDISLKTKVHELSVGLVYYIAISKQLKEYYKQNNLSRRQTKYRPNV